MPPALAAAVLRFRAEADAEFFATVYFPDHCRLPFAAHHRALFAWHGAMAGALPGRAGLRFVLAAPRGAAKSTVASLILPLHDVVFGRERYIVLLSATERQAMQRLRAMAVELRHGRVARCLAAHSAAPVCSGRRITCGDVMIEAHGAGTEIRGISHGAFRPTKIILDDAEASRAATSPRAREKLAQWFAEIVEHLGDHYTHILAIGTVLHRQGLIASLLERPDFTGLCMRSIARFPAATPEWGAWRGLLLDRDQPDRRARAREFFEAHRAAMAHDSEVLWPEKEDIEDLMCQLTLQGRRAFYQEKQNEPLGPEEALFDAATVLRAEPGAASGEWLLRRGGTGDVVRRLAEPGEPRRVAHLDAAMGKGGRAGRGDFSALAVVRVYTDGTLLLEQLRARRVAPSEQVRQIFDLHEATPLARLAIEGTGFQELLMLPIEEERQRRRRDGRRADLAVEAVSPHQSKAARITALEPMLANGTLVAGPGLDEEFWEELSNWPRSRHDDALDAVAGAVALARRHGGAAPDWCSTGTRRGKGGPHGGA